MFCIYLFDCSGRKYMKIDLIVIVIVTNKFLRFERGVVTIHEIDEGANAPQYPQKTSLIEI